MAEHSPPSKKAPIPKGQINEGVLTPKQAQDLREEVSSLRKDLNQLLAYLEEKLK